MADIQYTVKVNADEAKASIEQFDGKLDELREQSGTTEKAHGALWKQVALGTLAYQALEKAGRFALDFMKDSVTAAIEAEKADRALAASLEITGRPVQDLADHFSDMATELQGATVYEDEAIKRSQTLLIQLTNLDKDGLDRATKGAIGLASVMGMDLESAAQLVAKAMSGNVSMLSRYGITVDQTKTKEEQRAEVMAKLEQFYGRATAETDTFGGKLAQLKNKYGDMQESIGGWITKNHALMDSLNAVAEAIIFQLGLQDRLDDQVRTQQEMENKWAETLGKVAVEANMQYGAMAKLVSAYDGNTIALARAISQGKHGEEMQKALNRVRREEITLFQQGEKARKAAEKGTNKFTDEVKDATKAEDKFKKILDKMPQSNKDTAAAIMKETVPAMGKLTWEVNDTADALAGLGTQTKQTFDDFVASATAAWEKYGQAAMDVIYGIDAVFYQTYKNQEIAMENEYKKRVELIEKSNKSEEEKADAMAALDEEFDAKRSSLKAKQAKQDKAMSIIQATINTFEAASKAYTLGPIVGPIFAGIITALGLALVAKIKAQPIPMAKGGIFDRPTLMAGGAYEVAEAGEKEVVAPLSGLRRELGLDKRRGDGGRQNVEVRVFIGERELRDIVVKVVNERSRIGNIKISPRAVLT